MIEFKRIENAADPLFSNLYELYVDAFPPVERRSSEQFKELVNNDKRFVLAALMLDGKFVGLFSYWQFDDFVYAEHFAIDPNLRGKSIGSEVMEAFLSDISAPIVFEVEMPDTEIAARRIGFYERHHCKVCQQKYAQPYYDGSGRLVPMHLMTNNFYYVSKHFDRIKMMIYKEAYNYCEC